MCIMPHLARASHSSTCEDLTPSRRLQNPADTEDALLHMFSLLLLGTPDKAKFLHIFYSTGTVNAFWEPHSSGRTDSLETQTT